jgi:MFS family permease
MQTLTQSRRRWLVMGIYLLMTGFYWISLYLYVPTLPTYAETKTETLALLGVILAQYGLWQAIVRLPIGIAADWLGRRKPFILAGLVMAGLGAWVMGSADGATGLLVGRAITGLAAATWVPLTVMFSSLFPPDQAVRATSILSVVASVSRLSATASTGALNELGGYSLAFFLATGFAALSALILLPAPEKTRAPRRPSLGNTARLIVRRDVLVPALLSAVAQYAIWAVPFAFLPLLAERLGGGDMTQSLLVSLHIATFILGGLVATTLAQRAGSRNLVRISFGLLSLGIVVMALAPALPLLFVGQFIFGLAVGTAYPVLMGLSIREVDEEERTTAMGLHQAVYAAGMFAGPWLSGILADAIGIRPMLGVTAAGCLALGMFLVRLCPGRGRGGPKSQATAEA